MTAAAKLYAAGTRSRETFVPFSTGARWDLIAPDPATIVWRDVALRLARIPRFGGAAAWSVAEHCLLVMGLCPPLAKPWGLLHDAHEFALGDWTTPVKVALDALGGPAATATLGALEWRHARAIHAAAGLAFPPAADVLRAVGAADMVALSTERRDVLDAGCASGWGEALPAPLKAGKGRLKSQSMAGAHERVVEAFLRALVDVVGVAPEAAR